MAKRAKADEGDEKPKRPKQKLLKGMQDSAIPELEKAARRYAAIRDERIELNREEATLKELTMVAMKKHGKKTYSRAGITITLIQSEEDLKVKVQKAKGDDVEVETD